MQIKQIVLTGRMKEYNLPKSVPKSIHIYMHPSGAISLSDRRILHVTEGDLDEVYNTVKKALEEKYAD